MWKSTSELGYAIEQTQLRRKYRVDGVGSPKFDFHSDMCRAAVGGSLADFLKYARNPTFAQLVDHESWSGKLGNRIPATQTRGALTTTMVTVQTNRGQERKFLWTLQQQRRPPDQGCWLVHECLYVENAIEQTL